MLIYHHSMKRFVAIPLMFLLFSAVAYSQNATINCGEMSVVGPSATSYIDEITIFRLVLEPDIDDAALTIKWTVKHAEIVSGQGTKTLSIRPISDSEIPEATADVSGPGDCRRVAMGTGLMVCPGTPSLIAEFGDISKNELYIELNNLFENLVKNPSSIGYVITYGSDIEIKKRQDSIRAIIGDRRCHHCRIIFVNAGLDKDDNSIGRTRIWIAPPGADVSIIN